MSKLKTLNDLKYHISVTEDKSESLNKKSLILHKSVEEQDLRKEAIKWIKELEWSKKIMNFDITPDGYWFNKKKCNDKNKINRIMKLLIFQDIHCSPNLVIKWIKYFFNIKEEDLK